MGSKQLRLSSKGSGHISIANKQRRQDVFIKRKKAKESSRRDERFRRRREEDKNPRLRNERLQRNVPLTLDRKRVWDDVDSDTGEGLGVSVDVNRLKRQKLEEAAESQDREKKTDDSDWDSMIDTSSDTEDEVRAKPRDPRTPTERATSPTQSTGSTNLNLMPEALATKFPSLFSFSAPPMPKILITTSLNSTLHGQAQLLTNLFPNSVYIPRSAHRYAHKYSVHEIASFATNRNYTAVIVLNEDQKRPSGLDFVHLPNGPMFHFSITNWIEGKKIPGHGAPTNHYPELILNNFRTPLGLLTARLFHTMFPPQPEFQGRQVVTLHNQRDFIFVRRHRYGFREKRPMEKVLQGADGKGVKGMEGIRAGLQELGPRFTMKLRRVDKGIQRRSGQEWEWKGKTDKIRTKFQL